MLRLWHNKIRTSESSGKVLALALCCLVVLPLGRVAMARELEVLQVRTHSDIRHTRVVLDLNRPAAYEVFRQESSGNVIIRVAKARHAQLQRTPCSGKLLRTIVPQNYEGGADVVLALFAPVKIKYFSLEAVEGAPNRIVVDLFPSAEAGLFSVAHVGFPWRDDGIFTVIIDPGHGGMDSGAVRGKVLEKNVVLDIALRVEKLLFLKSGFKVILTREKDNYPSLKSRVALAEQGGGDVLLSIHCNTHEYASVRGTEVYCQSVAGARKRLEDDLCAEGRVSDILEPSDNYKNDDALAGILLDVHMGQVMKRSVQFAENILEQVDGDSSFTRRRIRQGEYKILDSLSMPAALVEVAFLSNPDELKLLSNPVGRQRVAVLLANAIVNWKQEQEGCRP